jgi:hypothetical protein
LFFVEFSKYYFTAVAAFADSDFSPGSTAGNFPDHFLFQADYDPDF